LHENHSDEPENTAKMSTASAVDGRVIINI